jgi:fatty acid desaturase
MSMDEFARQAFGEWEARRIARQRVVWMHALIWAAVNLLLFVVWLVTGAGFPWFVFPLFGWLIGLVAHAASAYLLRGPDDVLYSREAARRRAAGG